MLPIPPVVNHVPLEPVLCLLVPKTAVSMANTDIYDKYLFIKCMCRAFHVVLSAQQYQWGKLCSFCTPHITKENHSYYCGANNKSK